MYKVLIVEDEPEIAEVLREFLAKTGFEAFIALGGEKAIEILNSDAKIDFIILDMKMPKISGIEVLSEMRNKNLNHPVVILTGSINEDKYVRDIKNMGYPSLKIVSKPVDLFELVVIIKNKLDLERSL